jgi:hypothetical protein
MPDGQKQVTIRAEGTRDFAVLCSHRFQEFVEEVPASPGVKPVRVKCLAFPEHEHYARATLQTACEVIPVYSRWFGPYVYPELTFVESYFGWNGNECSTLVMIDERIFSMPRVGCPYVEYLVSHEIAHQWWYNLVGTNGYCETWMDEAIANCFAHRHMNIKYGEKNTPCSTCRAGTVWLPNIRRQDYRHQGLYGTLGRGEGCPAVQDMPKFSHVVTLFSMAYDKGGKIVGMIEDRLGEPRSSTSCVSSTRSTVTRSSVSLTFSASWKSSPPSRGRSSSGGGCTATASATGPSRRSICAIAGGRAAKRRRAADGAGLPDGPARR